MKDLFKAIVLVLLTTVFTSFAQVLLKFGADSLPVLSVSLFFGAFLYVCGAGLLVLALSFGSVSVVYPFLSSSYIWVSLLSAYFFGESIGLGKWLEIFSICGGICLIAVGG